MANENFSIEEARSTFEFIEMATVMGNSIGSVVAAGNGHIAKLLVWSDAEREQAGRLLVCLRAAMVEQGILSIHDSRIGSDVRRLWQRLVDSNALDALTDREIGLLWEFIQLPKDRRCAHVSRIERAGCPITVTGRSTKGKNSNSCGGQIGSSQHQAPGVAWVM